MATTYRQLCEQRGVPRFVLMREGWIAPTRDQAIEEYGPRLLSIYRYYWQFGAFSAKYDPWLKDIKSADELTLDKFGLDRFIIGFP